MHIEKIKVKLYPLLTTIIIACIIGFSNLETTMNLALREQSGEKKGSITLKGKALNAIEWSFESTTTVSLLIIKEVTWDYINDLASQYGQWIKDEMLENSYTSQDKRIDSGLYYVHTKEKILLMFSTTGVIKYCVKYDPFCIDVMWIFYGLLGLISFIGIINSIRKIKKIKIPIEENLNETQSCEYCGSVLESESIFCHECGKKLNKYKPQGL